MSVMKKEQIRALTEGAVMVAMATVLSLFIFAKLPFGGSVTLLSMFPIVLYSIRHGVAKGLFVSFVYAVLQLLLDIGSVVSWGLTPGVLVACILMDYLVPFTCIGIGGIFRRQGYAGWLGGTALAIILRFAAHYLSGVYVWKTVGEIDGLPGVSFGSPYVYSLVYNGLYMLPELILTMIAAAFLFKYRTTKKLLIPEGVS